MKRIKVFVMDVDGTLTDGKIYMGSSGELIKAFDIKDGYGIHEVLPSHHVMTVILTGRTSEIVLNRAKELEVDYVLQNVKDKEMAIRDLAASLGCCLDEIAYIGDDMIDLEPMRLCGVCGCPVDAIAAVRDICDFVSEKRGGDGAVRDFIEWLVRKGWLGGENEK